MSVSEATPLQFNVFDRDCPGRTVMEHITTRWGVLVLGVLFDGTLRFGEIRQAVGGVSEKMLAQTLRTLEADGFVHRDAQLTIPPRVDYRLTDRGHELAARLLPLMDWIASNADEIVGEQAD